MRVMIDIETMSLLPNAAVRSIGAVHIDSKDTPTFYCNVNHGLSPTEERYDVSASTLEWWRQQSAEVKDILDVHQRTPAEACGRLAQWLEDIGFNPNDPTHTVWANGAQFDIVVLESMLRIEGCYVPWKYSQVRDYRTILREYGGDLIFPENKLAHNALSDAKHQAECLLILESVIET